MNHKIKLALVMAIQHEVENTTKHLNDAEMKIETNETQTLKEFWTDNAEFWKKELTASQEALEWLQAQPIEYNDY